jgi:hypothetical protein
MENTLFMWVKINFTSKSQGELEKIVSVLNFPTFSFVYKIVVVKNIFKWLWQLNLHSIGTLMFYPCS